MMARPPSDPFLESLGESADSGRKEQLEAALWKALEPLEREHPGLAAPCDGFLRFLGRRCRGADGLQRLETLCVGDLFVAWAALEGDRAGIRELDAILRRATRGTARIRGASVSEDEVRQRLRERLLVPGQGGHRKLAEYAGTGPLEAWCRVAATRIALRLRRPPDREVTLNPELLDAGAAGTGLETGAHRRQHAQELTAAFAEAMRDLGEDDRVLLRYHFVDGLNFEEIAALYRTHRSTISRRVGAARKRLLDATERGLRERLGLATRDLPSVLRAARSEVEVDLSGWLRTR